MDNSFSIIGAERMKHDRETCFVTVLKLSEPLVESVFKDTISYNNHTHTQNISDLLNCIK